MCYLLIVIYLFIIYPPAKIPGAEVDLMSLVRDVLFNAVVPTLFGSGVLPQSQKEFKQFQKQFVQFDGSFEHGAKVPEFLLKDWSKSKHFLLGKFSDVLQSDHAQVSKKTLCFNQWLIDSLETAHQITLSSCSGHHLQMLFQ